MKIISHPSPNFGDRRGQSVQLIVLHYTAMASAEAALERLCDPGPEVSAHYLIGKDGRIWQLVPDDRRAWHAGAGNWSGEADVNSRSIGIELDNSGVEPFPEALMSSLEGILVNLLKSNDLTPSNVIGHSDMAPGRKIDPGPRFDWRRLALHGLAVWPKSAPDPGWNNEAFLDALNRFGYSEISDQDAVLKAFRNRFLPGDTGPISARDRCTLAGLL